MQKFFRSGAAFMVVALLSIAAGLISERKTVFLSAGAVWFIMAIFVRAKNAKKPTTGNES